MIPRRIGPVQRWRGVHVSRGECPPPEPARNRAQPSPGRHGGLGPGPPVDLSAARGPAVLSAEPAARGGASSHQDYGGGRMAAPGGRGVGRANLSGVRWGLCRAYRGAPLFGASRGLTTP
jgi:hypothetical protein